MFDFVLNPEFWKYLSIPVVASIVGWGTNWVAIKLTFLPLEFVGIYRPWLGWQGIIPSKARKMAAIGINSTLSKLGSLREVFEQMEPDKIAHQIVKVITPRLDELTDDVIGQNHKALWENLPLTIRSRVYARVHREFPRLIENLIHDIGDNIEDLIDLHDMIISHLSQNKALLNRIFIECGRDEFRFIIRSGWYLGCAFGLIQMGVWAIYQGWWVLPFFGFLVGCATNWIALNIIFRPLYPVDFGPCTLQGIFVKRQKQVAEVYSRLVTHEIITIHHIANAMLNGPKSPRCRALIKRHLKPIVDESVGMAKLVVQGAVGLKSFEGIKEHVGETALEVSIAPFDDPIFNRDRADIIQKLMRERMEQLPAEDFVELLRPCFQEDEWKLVILGGALGFLAGLTQLFAIFGGM